MREVACRSNFLYYKKKKLRVFPGNLTMQVIILFYSIVLKVCFNLLLSLKRLTKYIYIIPRRKNISQVAKPLNYIEID